MNLNQNDLERITDRCQRGVITPDQANVMLVRCRRVLLVTSKIPANVRRALNNAVKSGALGRMKKDGCKPEVYFHPRFDYLAKEARDREGREIINASSLVTG